MLKIVVFTALVILLLSPRESFSQVNQPLVTDRPDFTESGITVPVGTIQIEGGVTVAKIDKTTEFSGSELLLRWSPANRIEIRLGGPSYAISDNSGTLVDPSIGFKIQLGPVRAWDVALIGVTTIPLGDEISGLDTPEPFAILAIGGNAGPVGIGSQVGGFYDSGSESILGHATAVVGTSLAHHVGGFLEIAFDQQPVGQVSTIVHSGLTIEAADLVQLDVHVGLGISDTAPDYLFGIGLSLRR